MNKSMINNKRQKVYSNHIFSNIQEISADFNKKTSKERMYMESLLKPMILDLQNSGINNLINYTRIFKDGGINCDNISKIATFLLKKLCNYQFKKRTTGKMNSSDRNVVFNYLFHKYSNDCITYIIQFVEQNCNNIYKHDFLIYKLNEKLQEQSQIKDNIIIIENDASDFINNYPSDNNDDNDGFDFDDELDSIFNS